jgi:hypothetical protein
MGRGTACGFGTAVRPLHCSSPPVERRFFMRHEIFAADGDAELGRNDRRLGGVSLLRLFSSGVRPITPTPTLRRQGGGRRKRALSDRLHGIDVVGILP